VSAFRHPVTNFGRTAIAASQWIVDTIEVISIASMAIGMYIEREQKMLKFLVERPIW
jgi:hypothetical protein